MRDDIYVDFILMSVYTYMCVYMNMFYSIKSSTITIALAAMIDRLHNIYYFDYSVLPIKCTYILWFIIDKYKNSPWKCDVDGCGSTYNSYHTVAAHKRWHKDQAIGLRYECSLCNLTYSRRTNLNAHLAKEGKQATCVERFGEECGTEGSDDDGRKHDVARPSTSQCLHLKPIKIHYHCKPPTCYTYMMSHLKSNTNMRNQFIAALLAGDNNNLRDTMKEYSHRCDNDSGDEYKRRKKQRYRSEEGVRIDGST